MIKGRVKALVFGVPSGFKAGFRLGLSSLSFDFDFLEEDFFLAAGEDDFLAFFVFGLSSSTEEMEASDSSSDSSFLIGLFLLLTAFLDGLDNASGFSSLTSILGGT